MTIDDAIKRYNDNAEYERTHGNLQGCLEFSQLAEWLRDYKRLKEQEPRGDLISREAVLDTISELNAISFYEAQEDSKETYYEIRQAIKDLPPVKLQEPKTGRWEEVGEEYIQVYDLNGISSCGDERICSECGFETVFIGEHCSQYKFCPNCGAKMEVEQDG